MSKAERKELEKASELSDKGRYDEAIARLEVLQTSSDAEVHDLALNFLADAYAATGRDAEAEAMLRRSIRERGSANEGLASQLAVLAPLVRRQGRTDEAEEIYREALDRLAADEPELRAITMRNLAYLYWSTGRRKKAQDLSESVPRGDEGFEEFLGGTMKQYIEPEVPL